MAVYLPIKKQEQERIPNSQYIKKIKTENSADEAVTEPVTPPTPEQPETK